MNLLRVQQDEQQIPSGKVREVTNSPWKQKPRNCSFLAVGKSPG